MYLDSMRNFPHLYIVNHGSKLALKFASKVQELLLVADHVIKKCAIKILTEKSHKEKC